MIIIQLEACTEEYANLYPINRTKLNRSINWYMGIPHELTGKVYSSGLQNYKLVLWVYPHGSSGLCTGPTGLQTGRLMVPDYFL
jgi:hypothetical protein